VAINYSGLPAFEDYLRARYSMYLQLYFHKSSVAAEAMIVELRKNLGNFKLPANIEKYAALDEYKIHEVMINEAKEIKDETKREACINLINNLLFERDLWKRVFEISGTDAQLGLPILEQAKEIIEAHGYPYQQVSSANSLTRFQPRDENNKRSKNYLRIIKKDIRQFPRVIPIEDHSTVIEGNQKITIHRIYASASFDNEGRYIPQRIKELLNQKFSEE
jgi:HD superfamily phosphohydrolase